MFAQVVAMIAGEDDDGIVALASCLQRGKNLADQLIDEADRCVIGAERAFLLVQVHLVIGGRSLISRILGNIILITRNFGRQNNFTDRVRSKIFFRSDQRYVWPYESHCQKEGLFHILVFVEELDGFLCRFAVRVNQIIALGLDDIEALATTRAFLQASWIIRQLLGQSGHLRFRAFAVVGLIP